MDIRENIKNNLYNLRVSNNLTQTDFGIIFDKKKTTVATWEQGKALPDVETLYRIATYFEKSMDFMYKDNTAYEDREDKH